MNVYLVENCGNSPGKIAAVFAHKKDAELFADTLPFSEELVVITRHLWYGQPSEENINL
jgi:hypothetical protein